jgi:hypothetical protein
LTTDPEPVRRYRAGVPRALEDIVHRCLAHDPARRPSPAALLPQLHRLIRSGPPMWPADFRPEAQARKPSARAPLHRKRRSLDRYPESQLADTPSP